MIYFDHFLSISVSCFLGTYNLKKLNFFFNLPRPSTFFVLGYAEPEHGPTRALMSNAIFNVHIETKHYSATQCGE